VETPPIPRSDPENTTTEPEPKAPHTADAACASMRKKPAAPAPAPAPAFDPMKTQKMEADPQTTQRIDPPADHLRTQRLDAQDPQRTTRLPEQPAPAPAP